MTTQLNISLRRFRNWAIAQQESVHFPTTTQPHGALLVLTEPDLTILQVSENVESFLGYAPEALLNQPLSVLLDPTQLELVQNYLGNLNFQKNNPLNLKVKSIQDISLSALIHRQEDHILLELEKSLDQNLTQSLNFYHLAKDCAVQLTAAQTLVEVCNIAVDTIRKITQFDRVMLYKFYEDNHGSVIAESKRNDLQPYLGLHYPEIDIPKDARNQFLQKWLRFIGDVNAEAVDMVPVINPITGQKTDVQSSSLRSASSCHLQYLTNMGVQSSITLSLIKDQKLWGLIACHHHSPTSISYEQRSACEFLAQSLSLELVYKEHNEDYEYKLALKDLQSRLLESMSNAQSYVDGLVENQQNLLDLVGATGAAICLDDRITLIGQTPDSSYVQQLTQKLSSYIDESQFFSTTCLADLDPEAAAHKDAASGLLAIQIEATPEKYLIWFRPEVIHTVTWAGHPDQSFENSTKSPDWLCPRTSFELWKETVTLQSSAWKSCEIDAALSLQKSIVKIVLKKADELAKVNEALKISEAREKEKTLQLQQTLEELKQTQTHLIQSEKMSSLGQLVAGIAHEINNPVNFIYGNLSHAESYTQDLLAILELYQQLYPTPPEEIEEECEAADLEFLVEDLPKLLKSMQIGADRIRGIVRSLRNFSRLDESEVKAVNIHEGIDSTLLILNNRLKSKSNRPAIEVIQDYGDLPLVECYPSQLNQVFMNVIANAIDALEEGNTQRHLSYQQLEENPNQIKISTVLYTPENSSNDWVAIEITDNGSGIPEDVQSKLFDPFFTTKPMGKGTGIGLAISYQIIVEKHQGTLTCKSVVGEGTTFRIEIPVQQ